MKVIKSFKNIKSLKGYLIGFIIGISFVSGVSYASTGTIGGLFEKIGTQWKLVGTNIKDGTVGTAQLGTNSVTTTKIVDKNVTEAKLADALLNKINNPNDINAVKLTGDQTVGGTKEFTSPVIGVNPTANNHLATKKYVDNAITTALASIVSYTYIWDIGGWSSCSESCGGGTQTRTVSCRRNDGVTVSDSFCTTTKPSTSQTCNTGACAVACGGPVSAGGFTYTTKLGPDGKCWTSTNMKHTPSSGSSWCFNNDNSNCNTYGRLYNGIAATHSSVCPALGSGWTLPTDDQWTALTNAGATGWTGNKLSDIVSSLPGYVWGGDNSYHHQGSFGYWWSSTEHTPSSLFYRYLLNGTSLVNRSSYGKAYGFSVVCIKN